MCEMYLWSSTEFCAETTTFYITRASLRQHILAAQMKLDDTNQLVKLLACHKDIPACM